MAAKKPEGRADAPAVETAKAVHAYGVYRDLGPSRSLEACARALHKSKNQVARWASAFDWQRRIAEHEAALSRAAAEAEAEAVRAHVRERLAKLQREQDWAIDEQIAAARLVIQQGKYMASFPVLTETRQQTREGEPVTLVVEGSDPSKLVAGARMIALGFEQHAAALRNGMAAWSPRAPDGDAPAEAARPRVTTVIVRRAERPEAGPDADGV